MRSTTLTISILAHVGAISAAAAVGMYVVAADRRPARVEIRQQAASASAALTAARVADAATERPAVVPEPVAEKIDPTDSPPLDAAVVVPPRVIEPDRARAAESTTAVTDAATRAWLTPCRRSEPPERVAVETAVAVDVEPTEPRQVVVSEPPQPARAFVAATPLATNPAPDYPERERRRGYEDTVVVTASVTENGEVTGVRLKTASRHRGFNRAALSAVTRWRFTPSQRHGEAVADEVDVPVIFQLRDR
ncbi:MAG: TonB family protein [bacterium]|nr:TonB family protein [bacterium]